MASFKRFEDIEAWQRVRVLAGSLYAMTRTGTFARDFGLADQINRAAVSVMSNIAEGFERDSRREFARYLTISKGSIGEVRAQLYLALDRGHLTEEQFDASRQEAVRISRMLAALITHLRSSDAPSVQ